MRNSWMSKIIALASLLCCLPLWAADILLLSQTTSPGLNAFAEALQQQHPSLRIRQHPLQEGEPSLKPGDRLILLDEAALTWRIGQRQNPPSLALRISRSRAEQLHLPSVPGLTLLWSDPPPLRQMRLARLLQPGIQRIGLLYGRHSSTLLEEYQQAAQALDLELTTQLWENPRDNRPLQQVLQDSDLLLAIDDSQLYNSQTAKTILLSSYSRQRAVIGPSAAFVKAGSLASSYSDQADWLATLAPLLEQPSQQWPSSLYPQHFKVISNRPVARALGLAPPDEPQLQRLLRDHEAQP